jgi:hypothetical protein
MRSYIYFYRSIGEKKCRECSGFLGGGVGGDDVVVIGGDVADVFGDDVSDIRLSKITEDDYFMLLLLNPQGLLREAHSKLTTANTNGGYLCYR